MPNTELKRESLRTLKARALEAFPEREEQILKFIEEIAGLMDPPADAESSPGPVMRSDDGHGLLTLLCKFEDYLESVMVGDAAKRAAR